MESGDSRRQALKAAGEVVLGDFGHGLQLQRQRYFARVPDASLFASELVFGSVWARPGLDLHTRMLVTLTVGSVLQRIPQLRSYLHTALNMGIRLREIEEVLMQSAVLAGFPAAVNSFEALSEVLEARDEKAEPTSTEWSAAQESLESIDVAGDALLADLFGAAHRVDALDQLEARFVFGQVFRRPDLTIPTRVLCWMAALCALGQTDEFGRWAVAAKRLGLTPGPLEEMILQCACYAGFPAARTARAAMANMSPA
jgi:4-carboxymuconolactone decarboxylase